MLNSDGGKRISSHNRSVDCNGLFSSRVRSRRILSFFSRACWVAIAGLFSSCGFSPSQPALPKPAAIESRVTPQADEKFDTLVQNADIIYFPIELLASGSEPAWKLIEALHRQGNPFALGSDLIAGDGQPLLDQWAKQQISTDKLISSLHLSGTPRERDSCRLLLSETKKRAERFLALGRPSAFFSASTPLSTREETALLDEEFAAVRIAGTFREQGDEKLLLFLHRRHLGSVRGVPYFVAQKIRARQLVLDSREHSSPRRELLTSTGGDRLNVGVTRRLEIVDGAPAPAHHQL
jgi:hypothetical protein